LTRRILFSRTALACPSLNEYHFIVSFWDFVVSQDLLNSGLHFESVWAFNGITPKPSNDTINNSSFGLNILFFIIPINLLAKIQLKINEITQTKQPINSFNNNAKNKR
jgi:hypothetical protein